MSLFPKEKKKKVEYTFKNALKWVQRKVQWSQHIPIVCFFFLERSFQTTQIFSHLSCIPHTWNTEFLNLPVFRILFTYRPLQLSHSWFISGMWKWKMHMLLMHLHSHACEHEISGVRFVYCPYLTGPSSCSDFRKGQRHNSESNAQYSFVHKCLVHLLLSCY